MCCAHVFVVVVMQSVITSIFICTVCIFLPLFFLLLFFFSLLFHFECHPSHPWRLTFKDACDIFLSHGHWFTFSTSLVLVDWVYKTRLLAPLLWYWLTGCSEPGYLLSFSGTG